MTRDDLLAALLVERFGTPSTDQAQPQPAPRTVSADLWACAAESVQYDKRRRDAA